MANISAGKILKKYRLSNRRQSFQKGIVSDESLVNYDAFEVINEQIQINVSYFLYICILIIVSQNNIKTSQVSNSSVVGHKENFQEFEMIASTKNNNYRSKSPLKPSNLGSLQINNIIDLV